MRPDPSTGRIVAMVAIVLVSMMVRPAAAQFLPRSLQRTAETMSAPDRAELQRRSATLAAMTPAERTGFMQRLAQWDRQVPALQRERRDNWQAWQSLTTGERARLQAAQASYARVSVDGQLALRARFDALDSSERHGWLLGPVLGADYPSLHALFAQVPAEQREALLVALRAMTPAARADLAVLAQRTPPQERAALRAQWLATAPAQRSAWLRTQVVDR